MKTQILTIALAATFSSLAPLEAAPLESAEVTRLYNDVRVRAGQGSEREAVVGDAISGSTMVRTGMKSRTELRFNDNTLSRLGSNTVFSFERGSRDMNVGSGTLFLQVPKNAGGASIRTAAVTAAVTGTTIMIETDGDNVVKVIVLEGSLELRLNGDSRVKTVITAGQMVVMRPGADNIPKPVDVDLELLMKTSKLVNPDEFDELPDTAKSKIVDAVDNQKERIKDGELSKTNLVIPGAGTRVILTDQDFDRRLLAALAEDGSRGPRGEQGRRRSNGGNNAPTTIEEITRPQLLAGNWVLDDQTRITTNPSVRRNGKRGQGTIYSERLVGPYTRWAYGAPDSASRGAFQKRLGETGAWSVYFLENILIGGTPQFNVNGPRSVIFASPNDILLDPAAGSSGGFFDLASTGLRAVAFSTDDASILLGGGEFSFFGINSDLIFHANGPRSDLYINAGISLSDGDLSGFAGRDVVVEAASIDAHDVMLRSGDNIAVSGSFVGAMDKLLLDAKGSILVADSSELSLLTDVAGAGGQLKIRSRQGNVTIVGSSMVTADGANQRLDIEAVNGDVVIGDPFGGGQTSEGGVLLSASDAISIRASGTNQPTIAIEEAGIFTGGDLGIFAKGNGARILFNGFNELNGNNVRIYAEGSGSLIRFTGNTFLSADQARLAARRILVDQNSTVNVNASTIGIFANSHDYNLNGQDDNGFGDLNTGQTTPTIGGYNQR